MQFRKTPDNGLALVCVRAAGSRRGGLFKPECLLAERTAL